MRSTHLASGLCTASSILITSRVGNGQTMEQGGFAAQPANSERISFKLSLNGDLYRVSH